VLVLLGYFLPGTGVASALSVNSLIAFGVIVVLAYFMGRKAAMSQAKFVFIRLTVVFIFIKMFVGIALVVYHVRIEMPDDKLFIIPFLFNYLIFTIFEIYVLEKLGRIQPTDK